MLRTRTALLSACIFLAMGLPARASITLLLEQPYGGMGAINPTGHSAIYLDHVCAETPLTLRACRPGELGAVISRYNDINGFDWVAVPLLPYLYAVDKAEEIPTTVDQEMVANLRDSYRRGYLTTVAPSDTEGNPPQGNWYELVGSAFDRTIYGFQVDSTPEQDGRLIALLNDRTNVQRYNGAFRNCADFTRVALNRFYPHAVRRNFIADLGVSTPKSVARGLTHYAKKHPEANLQTFIIPQVRGSLPRSHNAQGVTESLLKKYGAPLTLLSPVAAGAVLVAYIGHGRFAMPRNPAVLDLSATARTSDVQQVPSGLQDVESAKLPVGRGAAGDIAQASTAAGEEATGGAPAQAGFFVTAQPSRTLPISSTLPVHLFSAPVLDMPLFH